MSVFVKEDKRRRYSPKELRLIANGTLILSKMCQKSPFFTFALFMYKLKENFPTHQIHYLGDNVERFYISRYEALVMGVTE